MNRYLSRNTLIPSFLISLISLRCWKIALRYFYGTLSRRVLLFKYSFCAQRNSSPLIIVSSWAFVFMFLHIARATIILYRDAMMSNNVHVSYKSNKDLGENNIWWKTITNGSLFHRIILPFIQILCLIRFSLAIGIISLLSPSWIE